MMPDSTIAKALVTVIIPSFNEEANIARIARQVLDEPWTDTEVLAGIVIVDDCSDDGTQAIAEQLAAKYKNVRVIRHSQRRGKNFGIRVAAAYCATDIVVVLDADVLLSPGCLVRTVRLLSGNPSLMGASCIIEPLPARSWRERASRSQALLVSELKRLGCAYLSAIYAIRAPAIEALDIPDTVADDAYITWWLRERGYPYGVCVDAKAYIRSATGLRDFARQTLRGRRGEHVTKNAVAGSAPLLARRGLIARALVRAAGRDPLGFLLYVAWYAVVLAAPSRTWEIVSISRFDACVSTKNLTL